MAAANPALGRSRWLERPSEKKTEEKGRKDKNKKKVKKQE